MTADRLAPFRYLRSHFQGRGKVTSAMLKKHYAHAKETFMATQGIVAMNASHLGAFLSYLQATYPLPAQSGGDGILASLGFTQESPEPEKPAEQPAAEPEKPAAEAEKPAEQPEQPAAEPEKPAAEAPKADRLEEQHRELSARLDKMSEEMSSRFADLREILGKILAKLEDVVVVEE